MKWKQKKSFITSFWLFKGNGFLRIVVGDWTTWNDRSENLKPQYLFIRLTLNDNFHFSIFVILRSLISWMFSVTPDSLPIHPQSWYKLDGLFKVNIWFIFLIRYSAVGNNCVVENMLIVVIIKNNPVISRGRSTFVSLTKQCFIIVSLIIFILNNNINFTIFNLIISFI